MGQSKDQPHLFCFGLGYTGMALARHLLRDGWAVSGTCRDASQVGNLASEGISAFTFSGEPGTYDTIRQAVAGASHFLSTVPPHANAANGAPEPGTDPDPVLRIFGDTLTGTPGLSWIGYLSTTGVYGDTHGAEVDEAAPVAPTGPRGRRRAASEQEWLACYRDRGCPVHIFRLPGIYGPGRSVFDQIRNGHPRRILKPGHRFNRIHVDDIVQTLRASMSQPNAGAIYNVCDNEAAPPADVTAHACTLMGVTAPPLIPFEEAAETMSDMALSFWRDNRTVANKRITKELGVRLLYPSYREGLGAILNEEKA